MPTESAGQRGPRATLADVAAAAGVNASTVSRALATPGRGNPETRERIIRIAEELNYTPSPSGRALASGRTGAVAVLVSDVTNPFYFGIIRGTQHELRTAGYSQLLVHTEEDPSIEESTLMRMRGSFDGAILAAPRLSDTRLAEFAAEIPLVVINRPTAGVPSVFIDTPRGFEQSIEHLVSLGHRRICYAAGPTNSWASDIRWRAVRASGERLGIETIRIGPFEPRTRFGGAAADAALNTGATACVAFNDLLAIGMLSRFAERGVRVPEDMSIVGCDDIFGADFCSPPLTTLTAPIERAGRVAVSMLMEMISPTALQAPARTGVLLATHLTIRSSTGPYTPTEQSTPSGAS